MATAASNMESHDFPAQDITKTREQKNIGFKRSIALLRRVRVQTRNSKWRVGLASWPTWIRTNNKSQFLWFFDGRVEHSTAKLIWKTPSPLKKTPETMVDVGDFHIPGTFLNVCVSRARHGTAAGPSLCSPETPWVRAVPGGGIRCRRLQAIDLLKHSEAMDDLPSGYPLVI